MKKFKISILFLLVSIFAFSQGQYRTPVRPTQNLIVMVADGTSLPVLSAARWFKIYNNLGNNLHIDPFICGTVKTFNSNSPIPCSAPAASAFFTGVPARAGNISIYPLADPENDILFQFDPARAYQPLATILEAARIDQQKAVGLVVTCDFTHATPAAAAAHHYSRGARRDIARQMAHQNLDVMFGSGIRDVSQDMKNHFARKNITYIANDIDAFRRFESGKVWALWNEIALPYELDRNPETIPSLREMTEKAIELLSQNENGFFLMVEGSQIDWLAHANDAGGIIAEFLAFDNAVGAALEFAKKDGNTTVVILSDHGNSGFSIGVRGMDFGAATLSRMFGPISNFRRTATGMNVIMRNTAPENVKATMKEYTGIELTYEEFHSILTATGYNAGNLPKNPNRTLHATLLQIMNSRSYFGFTTTGHTGEEVFLAAFHPQGDIPLGMNTNVEINHYLVDVLGLPRTLNDLTNEIFAKHTEVFAGLRYSIVKRGETVELEVRNRRNTLRIPAHSSVAYFNGEAFDLGSVAVYMERNETFYVPRKLAGKLR